MCTIKLRSIIIISLIIIKLHTTVHMQEQEAEKAIDISGCKLRENQFGSGSGMIQIAVITQPGLCNLEVEVV